MFKRFVYFLVVFTLLGTGGFFLWRQLSRPKILKTALVKEGPIVVAVYGLGTVVAERTFDLKIGISTTLKKNFVKEGDFVRLGDPLVELSDGGVFKAPFTATVVHLPYKPQETVYPQSPIVSLADLTQLYLLVSLEQQSTVQVKAGQTVRISFESLREQRIVGKVRSLFPKEGQFLVRVDVEGFPSSILPGMTADVAFQIASKEKVLLVPVSAIHEKKVTVRRLGKIEEVSVELGAIEGEWAELVKPHLEVGTELLLLQ